LNCSFEQTAVHMGSRLFLCNKQLTIVVTLTVIFILYNFPWIQGQ
jgi:hypothetical protein